MMNGIKKMLVSVLGFSAMGIIFRSGRDTIGPGTAMLWRSIVGLLLTLSITSINKEELFGKNKVMLILRGIAGASALLFFFASAKMIDLGTATALCYIYPFVATFLSLLYLKEPIGFSGWFSILFAWIGIAVIVGFRPQFGFGELFGFLSGILAGIAIYTVRVMRRDGVSTVSILFWFFSIGIILSFPFAYYENKSLGFESDNIIKLISIGITATIGQAALTTAYRELPAKIGSPISLLVIPCSMAGAYVFSSEIPSANSLIGSLIFGTALYFLLSSKDQL